MKYPRALCTAVIAIATVTAGFSTSVRAADESATIVSGTTAPSEDRKLGFNQQGMIGKVELERGMRVKQGDLIMQLDTRVEEAQLQYYALQADTSLQVSAAEEEHNLAQANLDMVNDRAERSPDSVTPYEKKEAQAQEAVKKIGIDVASRNGEIAAAQADAQKFRIEQMKLRSPIDGIIVDITSKEGETVRESTPVAQVVKLDPLNVDLKLLDVEYAARLNKDQVLKVRYKGDSEQQWQDAKVKFISPVGNAAARTRLVTLEMPNPSLRAAGMDVEVQIPPAQVAAGQ